MLKIYLHQNETLSFLSERLKKMREKLNYVIRCSLGSYISIYFKKQFIDKICVGENADPAPHHARGRLRFDLSTLNLSPGMTRGQYPLC